MDSILRSLTEELLQTTKNLKDWEDRYQGRNKGSIYQRTKLAINAKLDNLNGKLRRVGDGSLIIVEGKIRLETHPGITQICNVTTYWVNVNKEDACSLARVVYPDLEIVSTKKVMAKKLYMQSANR